MKHTEYIVPIGEKAQDYDEMFIGIIRIQPELVRCKDCKYFRTYFHGVNMPFSYECSKLWLRPGVNDYCSKGERKK